MVLFAGFFAPYDYATQVRDMPFAAPQRIHFVDESGHFHLRPFVSVQRDTSSLQDAANPQPISTELFPVRFFVEGAPYKIAAIFTSRLHLFGVDEPARINLLGTDAYGRDQFSRFLYGGQISLLAGLLAAALSVSLGILVGVVSGFYGGWIDDFLMRGGELFLALPWLYLLFAVRAALALAHRRLAGFSPARSRDRAHRLGAPRKADSRRCTERQRTQLRHRRAAVSEPPISISCAATCSRKRTASCSRK